MFDNKYIADNLLTLSKLHEVNGGEADRIAAYREGAELIRGFSEPIGDLLQANERPEILSLSIPLRKTIEDLVATGISPQLEELLEAIPNGVVRMLDLNGLGPKKARVIWKKMHIDNLGELFYACVENRLIEEKGFGFKTQEKIKKAIAQLHVTADRFHYATAQPHADAMQLLLSEAFGPDARIRLTGEMRRKLPIVSRIEFLCDPHLYKEIMLVLIRSADYEIMTAGTDLLQVCVRDTRILIDFLFRGMNFYLDLFQATGDAAHVDAVEVDESYFYPSEEAIYERAGLQFVPPELREGVSALVLAAKDELPQLLEFGDLKGLLHVHSTWSDGLHTLEEMAIETRRMGLEYMGISDHSHAAIAANGLNPARVTAQHAEIDRLNSMLHPFRILKGIEVDILPNGDLDYDNLTLASFDFVIASVHSHLDMSEANATARLLRAIRNPYTNILGHLTGRLLLARDGYPVDHRQIIDACAMHNVAIELNANPHRLDIDWKWIRYAVEKGVLIAINPNAHCKEDLAHVHWGIAAARKGMLGPNMTLNARDLDEIEEFFLQKRKQRIS